MLLPVYHIELECLLGWAYTAVHFVTAHWQLNMASQLGLHSWAYTAVHFIMAHLHLTMQGWRCASISGAHQVLCRLG